MNRRDLLKAAAGVGCGLTVVGAHFGRKAYARDRLREQLVADASAALAGKDLAELRELPVRARDEIRTWFHGPCLNAAEFAFAVTSEAFTERLAACPDERARLELFLTAFLRHVVSEAEIISRVWVIAEETGETLDRNWQQCCGEIADRWNLHLRKYGPGLTADLAAGLESMIRGSIQESIQLAEVAGRRPALGETVTGIGATAIGLMPLVALPQIALPLFTFVAVGHLYRYYQGLSGTADAVRQAVSSRLALLARRIGTEFETEVRAAVGRLHAWQQAALRSAAAGQAKRSIPSFF